VAEDRVSANGENAPHVAVALFRDRPELPLAAGLLRNPPSMCAFCGIHVDFCAIAKRSYKR
jgi:hypothetical protein